MCGNDRIGSKQADWGSTAAAIRAMNALQSACDRGFKALIFCFVLHQGKMKARPARAKNKACPAEGEKRKSPSRQEPARLAHTN